MTSIATASISEPSQSENSRNYSTQYVEMRIKDESVDGLSNVDDEHPSYSIKGMFLINYFNAF
jgi:hypothetical protein